MAQKIETTTRELRAGVRLTDKVAEIRWQATGHLSVRLLDASGTAPIAARAVKVQVPGEGLLELETDAEGRIFHPDVPFQDYELDLGDGIRVGVPAVAARGSIHDRHVPELGPGLTRLVLCDPEGFAIPETPVRFDGPDGPIETTTDDHGICELASPLPPGRWPVRIADADYVVEVPAEPAALELLYLELEA